MKDWIDRPADDADMLLGRIWVTVQETPDAPALRMYEAEPLSYAGLWQRSAAIAQALLDARDDRVPTLVLGHKSSAMLSGIVGCLRAGHAYVPVSLGMPRVRIDAMCRQIADACGAAPSILVAATREEAAAEGFDEDEALYIPEILDGLADSVPVLMPAETGIWVRGEETQYIIFTSGSTGTPKGIEVSENDVRHFMEWLETFPAIREGRRTFMDQAPYSFDLSEFELVGALATGGCLYALSTASTDDFSRLFAELADSRMDVWVSTPPFAEMCLADRSFGEELLPDLSLFLFCGDTLSPRTARLLKERFPEAVVANTYGPTESTVAVTYVEITDEMIEEDVALPVGRPRPGTELQVFRIESPDGPLGEACAAGQTGEVVIVGDTVAKGYLGMPEKTAHAFFEATLSDGRAVRAFRTGDLGHLDEDGMLRYEGRMGSLIKLNGFRIELGDVEAALSALSGVKLAAVVPVERNGHVASLKGYVMLDHTEPEEDETPRALRERLGALLPAYMVPRTIRVIDEMPLTDNGKIDRKRLAHS